MRDVLLAIATAVATWVAYFVTLHELPQPALIVASMLLLLVGAFRETAKPLKIILFVAGTMIVVLLAGWLSVTPTG
jgi:hypothetical membrane protein